MLLIARKHGVEIVIVNIAGRDKQEQAMQAMERLDFNNHFEGIRSRFEVVESHDVVTGINNFTVEQGDLLVLAPKRYPYFRNMFHPRSVTKGVVGQSEIPVMVI
jgi:hypothetical protein